MASHYEFFQRPTVHVNCLVLLSSAHSWSEDLEGFPHEFRAGERLAEITILNA